MSFVAGTAPWQVGPVSSLGRITTAALVALALNLLFAWQIAPTIVVALMLLVLVVAIRVARGFEQSLPAAALTFAGIGIVAAGGLALGTEARSALVVSLVLAVFGTGAALAAWAELRRRSEPAVIELTRPAPDGLARARRRPRVYR